MEPKTPDAPVSPRTIRPIKDRVLVKQDPPKEKVGSLFVLNEVHDDTGTVIAIGTDEGITVKAGDRITFKRRPGSALWERAGDEWEGLLMLREEDIIGVLE